MAAENILPLTRAGMASLRHTIRRTEQAIARGDLVRIQQIVGFALAAGQPGDTVEICTRCHLVDFPAVGKGALRAGTRIELARGASSPAAAGNNMKPDEYVGYLHEDQAREDKRCRLVFAHD